jgi:hypothetical protein
MQPSSILLAISNVETLSKFRHRLFVSAAVFLLLIFSPIFLNLPSWLFWGLLGWQFVNIALLVTGCVRYLIIQHSVIRQGTDELPWTNFNMPPDRAAAERALYGGVEGGCYVLGFGSPSGESLWVTDNEIKQHLLVVGESRRSGMLEAIAMQHLVKGRGGVVFVDEDQRGTQANLAVLSGLIGRTEDLRILGGDTLFYEPFAARQPAPLVAKKIADSLDIQIAPEETELLANGVALVDGTGLKWKLADLIWLLEEGASSDVLSDVLVGVSGNQSLIEKSEEFASALATVLGENRCKELVSALQKLDKVVQGFNSNAIGKNSFNIAKGIRTGAVVYVPVNSADDSCKAILRVIRADIESSLSDSALKKMGHGHALVVLNSAQLDISERMLEAGPKGRCIFVVGRSMAEEAFEKLFGTVVKLGGADRETSFIDNATGSSRVGNHIYFETNIPDLWDSGDLLPGLGSCTAEQLDLEARAKSLKGAQREAAQGARTSKR